MSCNLPRLQLFFCRDCLYIWSIKKGFVISIWLLAFSNLVHAQQQMQPLNSFYKDRIFEKGGGTQTAQQGFFPLNEGDFDLIPLINDSSKQYYDLTETLFRKYLFELKGKDWAMNITPIVDFSIGKELNDTIGRRLFQNSRGVKIDVNLFKNISFSTAFVENQARFSRYETAYYLNMGERYPSTDSSYYAQNAVIPGATRTKYFKTDGFDYAYAFGSLSYLPHKKVRISAGNNQQFIGSGHRSLFLSDNSSHAPYFKIDYTISSKWRFTYHRSRLMNLLRRPFTGSAEAYYETKGYSVNYLSYSPIPSITLSLFDGSVWNRGDSLSSKNAHPLYYNPLPLLSGILLNGKNEVSSLSGLNLGIQLHAQHYLYAQLAINQFNTSRWAAQLGYRGYNYFGLSDLMFQIEFNTVPSRFYSAENPRLNLSHYNLPLAHPKGQGFTESLIRLSYEWKRIYLNVSGHYYRLTGYNSSSLLALYEDWKLESGSLVYIHSELGYRFNRKMNLCLFGSVTYREEEITQRNTSSIVTFGLRTGLFNHYKDF